MTEFKHTPDSLADQLDQTLPAGAASNPAPDADPLVDAALFVASAPKPSLPPEARARIQSQVLRHARQQRAPLRPQFGPALRWALVACAVLIVMLIPAARVTLASVPGEALYPFKQILEQVEASLASSPADRALINLTHAERRTQEAQTLLSRGQFDPALIPAAYENMARAAAIVRSEADFDPGLSLKIQSQTAALVAAIDSLLVSATQPDQPLAATVTPWIADVIATRDSSALLLPATPTAAQVPSETPTPTVTIAPSATYTETPTPLPDTATPTASLTPEWTATPTPDADLIPTLAVNLIVTGPIEAINGNIVVIYGIEIVFDPDDPALLTLRVGDRVRISGSISQDSAVITVVNVEAADDSIAISTDGQGVWRDSGDCSNPPPPWAVASGWRRRCEGQPGSANQNRGNNQNSNPGQGQGQNRGQGQGRGQNNRSDDDD